MKQENKEDRNGHFVSCLSWMTGDSTDNMINRQVQHAKLMLWRHGDE